MSDDIQEPPHDDEAERALLGAALYDIAALDEAIARLDADDFYRERHRHIWRAMADLHADGAESLDPLTVADRLDADGAREAAGGMKYASQLVSDVPSAANASHYIDIVDRVSRQRQALSLVADKKGELAEPGADVDGVLDDLEAKVYDISEVGGDDTMSSAQELTEQAYGSLEQMHSDDAINGAPTGFVDIDRQMDGGPRNGSLIILAGRPGMGKTSLAMEMQRRQCLDGNVSALFASLEMSKETVGIRHMAGAAEVPLRQLRRGTASERHWHKLTSVADKISAARLQTDDQPAITPQQLLAKARRARAREGGLDVVYVDYLQLMTPVGDHGTRSEEIAELTSSLKRISKELDVPVIALAQLNRSVENRDNKRPKLKDLRGSGAIEQDADVAAFLYRDSYYEEGDGGSPVAELIFRKNRNGPTGAVRILWKPETPTFDDLDDRHRYAGGTP